MNLILTNRNVVAAPVMSKDEGGWVEELGGNATLTVQHTNSDVVLIGDKPDVTEAIKKVAKGFATLLEKLKGGVKPEPKGQPAAEDLAVLHVMILNDGQKPVRVMLGSGTIYNDIPPGASYEAISPHYIELREMGNVQSDPNQKEAA